MSINDKKLSKLQKEILMWIGKRTGITTREELTDKFGKVNVPLLRQLTMPTMPNHLLGEEFNQEALANTLESLTSERKVLPDDLKDILDKDKGVTPPKGHVLWNAKQFYEHLGKPMRDNKYAITSRSLKSLKERSLITKKGKYLGLTPEGAALSVRLQEEKRKI